jgi:hypothetical protein
MPIIATEGTNKDVASTLRISAKTVLLETSGPA